MSMVVRRFGGPCFLRACFVCLCSGSFGAWVLILSRGVFLSFRGVVAVRLSCGGVLERLSFISVFLGLCKRLLQAPSVTDWCVKFSAPIWPVGTGARISGLLF